MNVDLNLLRILSSLAFLPPDDIIPTFRKIKSKYCKSSNRAFFKYFENFWIKKVITKFEFWELWEMIEMLQNFQNCFKIITKGLFSYILLKDRRIGRPGFWKSNKILEY